MNDTNIKTRFSCANYKRLLPFLDAVDATPAGYFTFTSAGYEPLTVGSLGYSFMGCPVYSIMHTYDLNGDVCRDPDITFFVNREHGRIIPMTYQQDNCPFSRYGTIYQRVFEDEKTWRPGLCHEIDRYLNQWTKNILDQGFRPAQAGEHAAAAVIG